MERDLVLLHGWAMGRRVFEPVLPALSRRCRIHNLALPGYEAGDHGGIDRWNNGTGQNLLDRWSDDCLAAVPGGAVWLGWSLGATIAMNAALRSPGRVAALVLVSATPRLLRGPRWDAGVEQCILRDFSDAMRTCDRDALRRFALLQAGASIDARRVARALADSFAGPDVDPAALEAGLEVLERVDLRSRLKDLSVPVLAIHGLDDRIVPLAAGAYLAGEVPSGELVSLEAGHAPFVSRPREFSQAVAQWI